MGAGSSVAHIFNKENPRLKLFVSGKSIGQDGDAQKSFFTAFLDFDITNVAEKDVEEVAAEFCKSLAANNGNTRNLQKLITFVVQQLLTLPIGVPVGNTFQTHTQCSNGLFLLRIFLKHLVDTSGESVIQAIGLDDLWMLVKALIDFIVDHAVTDHTYMIHVYALQVILMLMATQMYSPFAPPSSQASMLVYTLLRGYRASPLTHILVRHVIAQTLKPNSFDSHHVSQSTQTTSTNSAPLNASVSSITASLSTLPMAMGAAGNRGFLKALGSAANFILQLPFHAYTLLFAPPNPLASPLTSETYTIGPCMLADTSLLLLLTLLVQPPPASLSLLPPSIVLPQSSTVLLSRQVNPYRECLCNLHDTEYADTQDPESPLVMGNADVLRIPMKELYNVLTSVIPFDDRTILLLYYLIHGNSLFISYVHSRTDLDTLLLPLLRILYTSFDQKPQQIYMILIVILILSQDSSFSKNVHELTIPTIPWYKDRYLVDISLGGFIILILIRTVMLNLSRLRDVYLHTNCLATLANISSNITNIHPFVALKLVKLLEMLAKRYEKIARQLSSPTSLSSSSLPPPTVIIDFKNETPNIPSISDPSNASSPPSPSLPSPSPTGSSSPADTQTTSSSDEVRESLTNELNTYADFIHIILSLLHTTLTRALAHNPHLVYHLLHVKEDLFGMFPFSATLAEDNSTQLSYAETMTPNRVVIPDFQVDSRFGPPTRNIWRIVSAFDVDLHKGPVQLEQQSVQDIMEGINRKARTWREDMEYSEDGEESLQFRYEEEANCGEFFMPLMIWRYVWCIVYHYSGLVWNHRNVKLFALKVLSSDSSRPPSILEDVSVADVIYEEEPSTETQIKISQ